MAKPRPFVIAPDNHGDLQDNVSVAAIHRFMDDFKPDLVIHLGDCWDFRSLRRGASDEDQSGSLEDDVRIGMEFFDQFFSHGKERYFLRGNHDQRAWSLLGSTKGMVRDYCQELVNKIEGACKRKKVKMLPYDSDLGVLEIGELRCIHGYHHGIGACRQHANVYRNSFFGHIHSIESAPVPAHKPAEARSIGCLCRRDIDYINAKTAKLRWGNGWAYGWIFDNGNYVSYQARKINDQFHVGTQFKTY